METTTLLLIFGGLVVLYLVVTAMFPADKPAPPKAAAPPAAEAKPDEPQKEFTADELKVMNGRNGNSLYVAVNGDVFDMYSHESGRDLYGEGSPYNVFAGIDASVGLGMMETKPENWKASVKDLTASEFDTMLDWHQRLSFKYRVVGKLVETKSAAPAAAPAPAPAPEAAAAPAPAPGAVTATSTAATATASS